MRGGMTDRRRPRGSIDIVSRHCEWVGMMPVTAPYPQHRNTADWSMGWKASTVWISDLRSGKKDGLPTRYVVPLHTARSPLDRQRANLLSQQMSAGGIYAQRRRTTASHGYLTVRRRLTTRCHWCRSSALSKHRSRAIRRLSKYHHRGG